MFPEINLTHYIDINDIDTKKTDNSKHNLKLFSKLKETLITFIVMLLVIFLLFSIVIGGFEIIKNIWNLILYLF